MQASSKHTMSTWQDSDGRMRAAAGQPDSQDSIRAVSVRQGEERQTCAHVRLRQLPCSGFQSDRLAT